MFAEVLKICEVSSSSANTPDQTVYPHVTKYTSVMQMHHIQVWLDGRIKKKKKKISQESKEMSLGLLCKLSKTV